MSFFSSSHAPEYVALLDIGSGSVTATISTTREGESPMIIWSTQERILIKETEGNQHTGKKLMTTLMNVALALGNEGLQALRTYDARGHIHVTQVSVSAPWSYTITKRATYNKEKEFTITNELIQEILEASDEKIAAELHEHEVSESLDLDIVSRSVTGLYANDYLVTNPHKQTAKSLRLTQSNTVIQKYLTDFITDVHNKVLPKTELRIFSFTLMLYYVLREVHPEMREYCLINQTLESTELGVVRNGAIMYCTHDTYGIATLVREIASITETPMDATLAHLQDNSFTKLYDLLGAKKQAAVDEVITRYQNVVTRLLDETGDAFTIPKTIYLHSLSCTYDFFARNIEKGAEQTTGFGHIVHNIDRELIETGEPAKRQERSVSCVELVSSRFFHKYNDPYGFIKT